MKARSLAYASLGQGTRWLTITGLGAVLVLGGCGGGGGDSSPSNDPPSAPLPQIYSFSAANENVTIGGTTTLRASFTNGTGNIDPGIGTVQSDTPVSSGTLTSDRKFTLAVTNADGKTATWSLTVHAVAAPQISAFTATPASVTAGQSSTLAWTVSGATTLSLDQGLGSVSSGTLKQVMPSVTTTYTLTATNAAGTAVTARVTVTVSAPITGLPRIRVDRSGATAVFRDANGVRFIPRGSSYVRLNWSEGSHHCTFQPGLYAPATVETALTNMEQFGYNIVRVFLDHGNWDTRTTGINGLWSTPGLDPAYMDNLSDFIVRATNHHIYVLLALEYLPHNQHYVDLMQPIDPGFSSSNAFWLEGGPMQAKKAYVTDLVDGLAVRIDPARLSTVFGYELESEMAYSADMLPFSSVTSTVKTADGQTYSMADPIQREACADNNMVFYANLLTNAIKSRDPGAMVTIGAFTYRAVGKAGPAGLPIPGPAEDQRFPVRISVLARQSRLDFIDLHAYPLGPGYTLADDLASSEWSAMPLSSCPVLMGEFGAFEMFYSDINAAATLVRDHEIEGWHRGFAGFLYWTYDTDDEPWPQLWTLMDANGTINRLLAPVYRPDPGSADTVVTSSPLSASEQSLSSSGRAPSKTVESGRNSRRSTDPRL